MLYPLGPTAVVLSWTRPYLGVFRKYVVEMFYFNPTTMTSEWTTYYEIAATVSLTSSVVMLPKPAGARVNGHAYVTAMLGKVICERGHFGR